MSNARISRKHRKAVERELKPAIAAKDARIAELERDARDHGRRLEAAQREKAELGERLVEFFERNDGVRMQVVDDRGFGPRGGQRYRLMLDLDEHFIRSALQWGNDHALIEHLGTSLGRKAMIEISRINFGRSA